MIWIATPVGLMTVGGIILALAVIGGLFNMMNMMNHSAFEGTWKRHIIAAIGAFVGGALLVTGLVMKLWPLLA